MEILSKSSEDTKGLAFRIAEKLHAPCVLLLRGDLGAGKTTFTQGLVEALGSTDKVSSPTFILLRQYKSKNTEIGEINHFDLYRVTSEEEAIHTGILDLAKEGITIIEWPELIAKYFKNAVKINFEVINEEERKINVSNLP